MWADWWQAHKLTVYFGVVLLAVIAVMAALATWFWWRTSKPKRGIWYLLDLYTGKIVDSFEGGGEPPVAAINRARAYTDKEGHTTALVVLKYSFQAGEGPATRALEDKR